MRSICTAVVATLVLAGTVSSEPISEAPPAPPLDGVHEHGQGDVADTERLHLTNCVVPTESLRFSTDPIHIPRGSVNVETIHDSGDPANRLDLVFVGDGYTAAEIPAYMNMVQDRADYILDYSPFDQYRNWINIHRVDVISAESGVDNDPDNGNVDVDTAMDMYFQDSTTGGQQLLMDWSLGYAYANLVPDVECILAAGNTVTSGGAGTNFDIATFSHDSWAGLGGLMFHEMAHSLMHLADEYYTEGDVYTGGERPERNISIMNAANMSSATTKWAHWLGYSLPDIGVHDTYEGAAFYEFGIYRPSVSSQMGDGGPLNGPSVEATILQLHLAVDPIESTSHPDIVVDDDAILSVDILHPNGHQLEITWRVNGDVIATGSPILDLGSITLPAGANLVKLTVVDPNPLVRDERLRSDFLTSRRAWVAYTGTAPSGACCLGESCFVTSEAECAANTGYWVEGEDCDRIGCYWFDSCMLVDSFAAGINTDLPPDMDVVGASIRRLPGNLIEARIELAGPPLPAGDPSIGNRYYRIHVDTDAPFMTGVDWDDADQDWGVMPIGGSYRGASNGVLDEVAIDGNTIIMWVDPNVLSAATEIAFFAEAVDYETGLSNHEALGQGSVPRWEDLDDDGIPDHCEVTGTTRDVCPAGCAYTTIQQAIDAASDWDEILVGPGTYTSTSDNVVHTLGKNVWLHSSHGPEQTIIDGQGLRRGIICNSGETRQMVIEGFTIQNGNAEHGGGMRCYWDSQPTLKNCVFRNNVAVYGGGVSNESDIMLFDCTFENNAADDGGAVNNAWGSSPTFTRCSFHSNTAYWNGGAIVNYNIDTSLFIECTFIGNIVEVNGGGLFVMNSDETILFNCTFDGNEAELGGGIYSAWGTLDIESCVFTDHAAGSGGGLYSDGTSVTVTGSDFIGNSVYWDGGGIDANGGDLVLDNCRFDNNEAAFLGGGISINGTTTQITGCRISGNLAGETGGGLNISNTVGQVMDTLFCENLPDDVAGEFTDSGNEFLDVCPADCDGDINGDGQVGVDDVLTVIAEWGMPYDVNDLLTVIASWGPCP
jgi:parallel beta-helix repeat protein